MLAFESFCRQPFHQQQHYTMDHHNVNHLYSGLGLEDYETFGSDITFTSAGTYQDNPSFLVEAPPNLIKPDYRLTPSHSPSIGARRHPEHPPSTLSSGPSVPSAASSTLGSPYSGVSHSMPYNEHWDMNVGLGIGPTIVPSDGFPEVFVPSGSDSGMMYSSGKMAHDFVGESALSRPRVPVSAAPVQASSRTRQSPTVSPPPLMTLKTSVPRPSPTIDTILEDVNSSIEDAKQASSSPMSFVSPQVPSAVPRGRSWKRQSRDKGTFKSPTTPASASPASAHFAKRRGSVPWAQRRTSTSQASPISPPEIPGQWNQQIQQASEATGHSPRNVQFQSPFLMQSGGNHVLSQPSSCWFPMSPHLCLVLFLFRSL